ncbi:hypothetical protein [Mycolicibacterium porcinum]|uniref:Uncharacterized protein n=1 Tax=Mycolicibacterium porcinum TaxID=39693 RepID=A0AAW5T106_9MYCO|nr:hypothetical protein [Mycolicibacterium porcinum]MCV7389135.1 hypothetical protein [Mycolicibacterium porcinum]ORB44667.1 hypothetical protein BST41_01835 [Mycolicibacterium porcinum]CDO27951.1 hypothetical protein BN979_00728 [Mycolicibacterium vulneris]
MFKSVGRIPVPNIAYVLLLLGFVSLGLFVTALALGSDLALVAGIALIACLGGAVAGFRTRARSLAQARQPDAPAGNVSIFSTPLRRDEMDQYLRNYRAMAVVRDDESMAHVPSEQTSHRRAA